MELTGIQKFNAINGQHINLKDCEGQSIHPVGFHTHTYEDRTGKEHSVLVIFDDKSGKMYKTEVAAFIDKFMSYDESFGSLPDEEKPDIVVTIKTSQAGNKYVNFDVVG